MNGKGLIKKPYAKITHEIGWTKYIELANALRQAPARIPARGINTQENDQK